MPEEVTDALAQCGTGVEHADSVAAVGDWHAKFQLLQSAAPQVGGAALRGCASTQPGRSCLRCCIACRADCLRDEPQLCIALCQVVAANPPNVTHTHTHTPHTQVALASLSLDEANGGASGGAQPRRPQRAARSSYAQLRAAGVDAVARRFAISALEFSEVGRVCVACVLLVCSSCMQALHIQASHTDVDVGQRGTF